MITPNISGQVASSKKYPVTEHDLWLMSRGIHIMTKQRQGLVHHRPKNAT